MSEVADSIFELQTPDGETHRFHLGGVVPVRGQEYVVLMAVDASASHGMIVTELVRTPEGLTFRMVEDEELFGEVMMQFAMMTGDI